MHLETIRKRLRASGSVQGVGFRPFVWRRAADNGLSGWVLNDPSGVTIEIQGQPAQLEAFLEGLAEVLPPLARIDALEITDVPLSMERGFSIRESSDQNQSHDQHQSAPISPDVSICQACLGELFDPNDRRFRYPFINCTSCGPRFTIVEDVPYDRPLTTMKSFPMCVLCQQEYQDPNDRRFHAQPNACPACGPRIWFVPNTSASEAFESWQCTDQTGDLAIEAFRRAVSQGQIVAVKGIGGFHLVCDATQGSVIAKLRNRKGRIDKPLAIMVASVEQARSFALLSEHERQLLESRERPIVLLRKRSDPSRADMLGQLAPGNNFVGVLLPYSPLHYLLIEDSQPLVITSGNISDEPLARTNFEAGDRLATLADCLLMHDREIHMVCDDSVFRAVDASVIPIRRSRGYAPLPIRLNETGPSVLAVGGELKSTFCVTKGKYAYVSQHIGDLGNLETLDALQRSIDVFLRLFHVEVQAIAADLHPGYLSSECAERLSRSLGVPLIRVQHHFAHAASLIGESGWPGDRPLIVCCFDGTGYGADAAIWGGEFLLASGREYCRVAHLEYTLLPGGDRSIEKPYRFALALLWSIEQAWDKRLPCVAACPTRELSVLRQQLRNHINCIKTSSVGRLFDAIASLIGIRHEITYEAQAAMELEAIAAEEIEAVDAGAYVLTVKGGTPMEIRCKTMLQRICHDLGRGVQQGKIAAKFHHAVANLIADVCCAARDQSGINTVGLTGGVFQNALLLRLAKRRLGQHGFEVLTHSIVPPNDGGLALGQAVVARHLLGKP